MIPASDVRNFLKSHLVILDGEGLDYLTVAQLGGGGQAQTLRIDVPGLALDDVANRVAAHLSEQEESHNISGSKVRYRAKVTLYRKKGDTKVFTGGKVFASDGMPEGEEHDDSASDGTKNGEMVAMFATSRKLIEAQGSQLLAVHSRGWDLAREALTDAAVLRVENLKLERELFLLRNQAPAPSLLENPAVQTVLAQLGPPVLMQLMQLLERVVTPKPPTDPG